MVQRPSDHPHHQTLPVRYPVDSTQLPQYPVDGFNSPDFSHPYTGLSQNSQIMDPHAPGASQELPHTHRRPPPMGIKEALHRYCHLPFEDLFLAVIKEDSTVATYSTLDAAAVKKHQFFNKEMFQQAATQGEIGSDSTGDQEPSPDRKGLGRPKKVQSKKRQRDSVHESLDVSSRHSASRPKIGRPLHGELSTNSSLKGGKLSLRVGDPEEVRHYYVRIFFAIAQSTCKIVAKAWVKLFEPKKQSVHPYQGGDSKAPGWWPVNHSYGPKKGDKIRHKEPDHQVRGERVYLLTHMLKLIVEPNSEQHEGIRHLGIDITRLKEVTFESLSTHFATEPQFKVSAWKECLNELFLVAKQEERHKSGEIDDDSFVAVTALDKDKKGVDYVDADEDSGTGSEILSKVKLESYQPMDEPNPNLHRMLQVPQADQRPQTLVHTQMPDQSLAQTMQAGLSHPNTSFMSDSGMSLHGHGLDDGSAVGLNMDFGTHHPDSRRPSMASDYGAPTHAYLPWTSTTTQSAPVVYTNVAQPVKGYYDTSFDAHTMPMNPHAQYAFGSSTFHTPQRNQGYDHGGSDGMPSSMTNLHLHHQ